jgi:hypothetical protein
MSEKVSKISVESNDPDLTVDINGYNARKKVRALALSILLGAGILIEALYLLYRLW